MVDLIGCFFLVDFLSGALHWIEDTYGKPGILGGILDNSVTLPNIDHHRSPHKITKGTYWETNSVTLLIASVIGFIALLLGFGGWQLLFTVLLGGHINAFHRFSHMPKPPWIVKQLQKIGILQSLLHHRQHHLRPYDTKYCILSNYLNPILDGIGFWRFLEWIIPLEVCRGSQSREGY